VSKVKAIVIAFAVGVTIVIVIFIVRDILSSATKLLKSKTV
jgi:capsular polysaccharide biosynthesis protein